MKTGREPVVATQSLEKTSEAPPHAVQRFRLTAVGGADGGRVFESNGERTVIGTAEAAELRLSDPTVSRLHCEIFVERDRVCVRDLGSTNGTRVDGVAISEAYLHAGARIVVGETVLRFEPKSERVAVPVSSRVGIGGLVGRSTAMRRAFAEIERAAATTSTVLIQGATGTGKERAAEAIHAESARRDGPFIVVDCSSLPPTLMESELFGHERGAFTGATEA
jgi:two-component system response regulator GlrR